MNKLRLMEKLLDGVQVDWKALGEIGDFVRGKRFVKTDMVDKGVPCIHYGEMYTHYGIWAKKSKSFLDLELASKLRVAGQGDVIIVAAGETIEDIGNGTAWLGEDDVVIHDACFSYRSKLDSKYVSYFLRTAAFKEQIKKEVSSGKISSINSNGLGKAKIPIPCPDNPQKSLEIQAEIARILDAFTSLTAELTVRKKQYNYYRDKLLSFTTPPFGHPSKGGEWEVEWKTLGEIGEFAYGYAAKAQDSGDTRFVRITDINTNGKLIATDPKYVDISEDNERYILKKNDLLMARTGATYGKTMIFEEGYPAIYAGFLIKLSFDEKVINPKFYWHFAQSDFFWNQANRLVAGGGQPQFNANALKEVRMPVPPISRQNAIVAILDKFDALTNSISEGLPREIELRQKQYEYYRDLLLSFPQFPSAGGVPEGRGGEGVST